MPKPRSLPPNPLNPAQYNREQTEVRMLSRKSGASAVRCLDEQANASVDDRIAQIKEHARSRISKIANEATEQIARLAAQKGKK